MAEHLITWTMTETHTAKVTTDELAELTGHPLADVERLVREGDFGDLDNGLADIEGNDTYQHCSNRDVESVGTDPTAG